MGCKLPRPGAAPGKSSSEDLTAGHGKRGDAEAALLHQGVRRTLRNDSGVGTARTTGHRKWRPELGGESGGVHRPRREGHFLHTQEPG